MCINCRSVDVFIKGSCVPSLPGCPRIGKVIDTEVSLTWTEPDNDGGAAITEYIIAYMTAYNSIAQHVTVGVTTTAKLDELFTCGRSYVFAVAAKNAVGVGDFSHFSERVRIPYMSSNYLFSCVVFVNFISVYVQA